MKLQDEILLLIARLEKVPREGLIAISKNSKANAGTALKKCLRKDPGTQTGLIEEHVIEITKKSKYKPELSIAEQHTIKNDGVRKKKKSVEKKVLPYTNTTIYYCLSKEGKEYIRLKYPEEYREIFATYTKIRKAEETILSNSNAAAVAYAAGAKIPARGNVEMPAAEQEDDLLFVSPDMVRSAIKKKDDSRRITINGVLCSNSTAMVLYHDIKPGMDWVKKIGTDEREAVREYMNLMSRTGRAAPVNTAVILVKNSLHFSRIINDSPQYRYEKDCPEKLGVMVEAGASKRTTRFGDPYTNTYFLPVSSTGAQMLRMLLTDKQAVISVFEDIVKERFDINGSLQDAAIGGFQIRINDCLCSIDPIIRMKNLLKCGQQLNNAKSTDKFGVVCFDWQREYYKAAFGENVQIYTIDYEQDFCRKMEELQKRLEKEREDAEIEAEIFSDINYCADDDEELI